MANIKRIKYAAKAPTYEYANEMIEIEAELKEGEDSLTVLNDLKEKVHSQLQSREDVDRWNTAYRTAKYDMERMKNYYEKALMEYSKLVSFCQAVGIKQDFEVFPNLPHIQNPISGYLSGDVNIPEIDDNEPNENREDEDYDDDDDDD